MPAQFGRAGAIPAAAKREGDGATPLGTWPIRAALLRRDRVAALATALPWRWLRRDDGWCDAPADPHYNRPVQLPYRASAEAMWRDDGAYDVVLVLGHNDAPPLPGLGSAIFWHCSEGRPTAGCIAMEREVLLRWLGRMVPGDAVTIVA
ncbi:hypothetical protein IP88_11565 [alpha proteobacterium AAP81b]|nr:hypothetical protein IP88_11565 [alpha proteobacterium AAP81b]